MRKSSTSTVISAGLIGSVFFALILIAAVGQVVLADDDLSFEAKQTYPAVAIVIHACDIDNDGYTDIVYGGTFLGPVSNLFIMYGKADGSYEEPVMYDPMLNTIAFDYINNDSLIDIVSSFFNDLYVSINNGDRTFTTYSISNISTNLAGVATGYFNDDSYLDIVGTYSVIYLGDGNGNFPETRGLPFSDPTVYVSDFSNDGIDDILAINSHGVGTIYINDGDCNFTAQGTFDLGGMTLGVYSESPFADFNRDGNTDFAFITPINYSSLSYISVGYGDGNGDLLGIDTLSVWGTSYSLVITDVNQDNILDLVAAEATHNYIYIFTGLESGGFSDSMRVYIPFGETPHAIGCGDLDRDGNPDFVTMALTEDSTCLFINQLADKQTLNENMTTTGYSNVTVDISNPNNHRISRNYRTVAGSEYRRRDTDNDLNLDEQAVDYNLQYGEYKLVFKTKYNAEPDARFSADINIGNQKLVLFKDYEAPAMTRGEDGRDLSDSLVFYYTVGAGSLISPANGGKASTQPIFDWSGYFDIPTGIESYNFQLDRYYDFRSPIYDVYDLETAQFTPDSPLGADSVYYWRFRTFNGSEWSEFSRTFAVDIIFYICGDVNNDSKLNIFDIADLISYLYLGGPTPPLLSAGDVDNNGTINLFDIIGIIEYLYLNGEALTCP
jgi:hypothetical protein